MIIIDNLKSLETQIEPEQIGWSQPATHVEKL